MKKEITRLSDLIKERPTIFDDLKNNIELPAEIKDLCNKFSTELKNSAIAYFELSDYQIALELFSKAILLNNQDHEIFYYMSIIYNQLEDKKNAYESINNALNINTQNEKYKFQKIDLLLSNTLEIEFNDQLRIIEDLLNSIDLCDDNAVDYYNYKSNLDYHYNKLDSALISINKVLELKQDNYDYYDTKAEILIKRFKFEEALVELNKAIDLSPDNHDLYYKRSKLYFRLAKYNDALDDIGQASKLYSEANPEYYLTEYDDLEFEIYLKLKNYDNIKNELSYLDYGHFDVRCFNHYCPLKEFNEDFDISMCSKNYDCDEYYEGPSSIKHTLYCHYKRLSLALNENYSSGKMEVYRPKSQYICNANGIDLCLELHNAEFNEKSKYSNLLMFYIEETYDEDILQFNKLQECKKNDDEAIKSILQDIKLRITEMFYDFAYIKFNYDVLSELKHYDELEEFLNKMLKNFPYDDFLIYLKADFLYKAHKYEESLEELKKMNIDLLSCSALMSLYKNYMSLNRLDDAEEIIDKYLSLSLSADAVFDVKLTHAHKLITLSQIERAENRWINLITEKPDNKELQRLKIKLHHKKEDYSQAFDLLETMIPFDDLRNINFKLRGMRPRWFIDIFMIDNCFSLIDLEDNDLSYCIIDTLLKLKKYEEALSFYNFYIKKIPVDKMGLIQKDKNVFYTDIYEQVKQDKDIKAILNIFVYFYKDTFYDFVISRTFEHIQNKETDLFFYIIQSMCYRELKDKKNAELCKNKVREFLNTPEEIINTINDLERDKQIFFLDFIIEYCKTTKESIIVNIVKHLKETTTDNSYHIDKILYLKTGFNLIDTPFLEEIKDYIENIKDTKSVDKNISKLLYYYHSKDMHKIKVLISHDKEYETLKALCDYRHDFISVIWEHIIEKTDYLTEEIREELILRKACSYIESIEYIDMDKAKKYIKMLKTDIIKDIKTEMDNFIDIDIDEINQLMFLNQKLIDESKDDNPIRKQVHKLYLALYDYYMRKQDRKREELKNSIFQSVSHTLNNILVVQNVTLHDTLSNPESSVKKLLMYNEIISSIMKSIQLAFASTEVIRGKIEMFKDYSQDRMNLYDVFWFCFALNFNQLLSGKGYWEAVLEEIFSLNNKPENFETVENMIKNLEITEMNSEQAEIFAERFFMPEYIICNKHFNIDMAGLKDFYVEKDSYTFSIFFIIFLELIKNSFKYGFLNTGDNKMFNLKCKVNTYDFTIEFSNNFNNSCLLQSNTLQGLNMVKLFADMLGNFEKKTLDNIHNEISQFVIRLKIEKGRVS